VKNVAALPDHPGTFAKIAPDAPAEYLKFPANPRGHENAVDGFNLSYLPPAVAQHFGEAASCYSHGLLTAFAVMCRLTAQAVFADLGEDGKLRIFDQLDEVRELGEIDASIFNAIRQILLDSEPGKSGSHMIINRNEASVLMEVVKDMLYQTYVRGGKLRSALWMRRYFADEKTGSDAATA
jgi:hypothetical protein